MRILNISMRLKCKKFIVNREKTQLRFSINELRNSLDSRILEFNEEKQKIESSSLNSQDQYKKTLNELRERLENQR